MEFDFERFAYTKCNNYILLSGRAMASILIFGGPELARPFVETIPASFSVIVHGLVAGDFPNRDNVRPLADPGELQGGFPDDLRAIVDLDYDRAARERNFDSIGRAPAGTLFITNALTMTATEAASKAGGLPAIGIGYVPALYGASTLLEAAPALQTTPEAAEQGFALLRELAGKELEIVTDRIALVSARTLAMIVNEAAFALMEGVADPEDIDVAMKLGTNYPEGPLRWADIIGPDIVLQVLQGLYDEYQEERYRPCVLLKQLVRAGSGFHV